MILNAVHRDPKVQKLRMYCAWGDVENKTIPLILCAEEDVDGSHGATIGELDEETLFYFAARGIDQETAEDIMTKAKLEVLYQHIQDEETERIVADQLTKVMSNDSQ